MIEALALACFVNCGGPPKRFAHKFNGPVVVVSEFMPDKIVGKARLHTFAWTFGNVNGTCTIHLNTTNPVGSEAETVWHEIAHCNGWPANHPR